MNAFLLGTLWEPLRALAQPKADEWPVQLHTFKGFSYGISFSPDSRTLAAGGLTLRGDLKVDRDIVLWDISTGKDAVRLKGQPNVLNVACSPNGKLLAASGDDLRMWNVETGKTVSRREGRTNALAFHPNGKLLATGVDTNSQRTKNTIIFWEATTLKQLESAPTYKGEVRKLVFSPDGKTLAIAGVGGGEIVLWNTEEGKERAVVDMGTPPKRILTSFPSIAFSGDSKTLAVAVWYAVPRAPAAKPQWEQRDVHLWDVGSGKSIGALVGHERNVTGITFSPDRKLLASTADNLRIWDIATKKVLKSINEQFDTVAFSPDGNILAAGESRGGNIKLWNVKRTDLVPPVAPQPRPANAKP